VLTLVRVLFGALCALKAVDIGFRGVGEIPGPLWLGLLALWLVATVGILAGRHLRLACLALIVSGLGIAFFSDFDLYNQHLYVIMSTAAILGFARPVEASLLLRAQLTIVYAFAALAKINESFLSGNELFRGAVQRPIWDALIPEPPFWALITLSCAAIATEAFLAVGLWFRHLRWLALAVGLGFHVILVVFMSADLPSLVRLMVFAGAVSILYLPFFEDVIERQWPKMRPSTPAPVAA
jgi:hypothetical protein